MRKLLVILCLFLVACGSGEPVQQAQTESAPAAEQANVAEQPSVPVEQESKSAFDLSSALTQGLPVKCVSTKDGVTATMHFKGKNVRMDTSPVDAHGIYTEEWMYTWSGNVGTKMRMEDLKKLGEQAAASQQAKGRDDLVSEVQSPDVDCESASVSDDLFVPPSNVQFQDLGALLSEVGMAIPQGMNIPQ